MANRDIFGNALKDFFFHGEDSVLSVFSPDFDDDEIPVSWYFRKYSEMPEIEKKALELCHGRILDLGAGAGCHSLVLQRRGMDVTSADISPGAVSVMKERGLAKVVTGDIYTMGPGKYDTILMMMNGIGITGSIDGLENFLNYLPNILVSGGQVVFDSSNLIYLYQDEDGFADINLNDDYYGEIEFSFGYKGVKGEAFRWLYIDFDTLSAMCEKRNYGIEFLHEGDNLQYLARILL